MDATQRTLQRTPGTSRLARLRARQRSGEFTPETIAALAVLGDPDARALHGDTPPRWSGCHASGWPTWSDIDHVRSDMGERGLTWWSQLPVEMARVAAAVPLGPSSVSLCADTSGLPGERCASAVLDAMRVSLPGAHVRSALVCRAVIAAVTGDDVDVPVLEPLRYLLVGPQSAVRRYVRERDWRERDWEWAARGQRWDFARGPADVYGKDPQRWGYVNLTNMMSRHGRTMAYDLLRLMRERGFRPHPLP